MFGRREKIWKHYPQDITAINNQEAIYILHYISFVRITRSYLHLTEIVDLQRYRLVKKKAQVLKMLSLDQGDSAFLFPVNKN